MRRVVLPLMLLLAVVGLFASMPVASESGDPLDVIPTTSTTYCEADATCPPTTTSCPSGSTLAPSTTCPSTTTPYCPTWSTRNPEMKVVTTCPSTTTTTTWGSPTCPTVTITYSATLRAMTTCATSTTTVYEAATQDTNTRGPTPTPTTTPTGETFALPSVSAVAAFGVLALVGAIVALRKQ